MPPARLAYTDGSDEEPEQFRVTVTLDAVGNAETELELEIRFPSATDLDNALETGTGEGATQTLDRLGDHLTGGTPAES